MPSSPRKQTPTAAGGPQDTPVVTQPRPGQTVTPAAHNGGDAPATTQAGATAPAVQSGDKQEVSAARVNRQQAAVAAAVKARQQAATAGSQGELVVSTEAIQRATAPVAQMLSTPVTVGRKVAEDIASTARRPDAVLFWAGLAGLTALGALDWPAAAAIGVGIAVASGVRRART